MGMYLLIFTNQNVNTCCLIQFRFVGDCQIALACSKFVDNYGQEIINRNLYRNFILHLNNLFDFGVLSATAMRTTIRKLHQLENQCLKKKEESK